VDESETRNPFSLREQQNSFNRMSSFVSDINRDRSTTARRTTFDAEKVVCSEMGWFKFLFAVVCRVILTNQKKGLNEKALLYITN